MRLDSRTAIYCHELLHKKHAPNTFPGLEADKPDPVVEEFKNLGFSHEEKAIKSLKEIYPDLVEINQEQNFDAIQRETVKAIFNPKSFIITGAYIAEVAEKEITNRLKKPFKPSERSSRPDVMIKVGVDADGNPQWAPVDIKSHKAIEDNQSNSVYVAPVESILPNLDQGREGRLDYNDLHQLAHYTRHFQQIGIAPDDLWVGIIGRDISSCVWMRIGDVVTGRGKGQESFLSTHDMQFEKAKEVIRLSIVENEDATKVSGVIPVNSSGKMGCTVCKYKSTCLQEMKEFDQGSGHVTLLARVTPLVVSKNFPEVKSIRELMDAIPANDAMVTAQIRARVLKTGAPELIDPSEPFSIPEADIEIDIDLENSMEALRELEIGEPIGEDRLYLYGFGIHDRTVSKDWQTAIIYTYSDYSNTEAGEFEVLSKMWNRIQEEISKAEKNGRSIKVFHYSPHEFTWWKRFTERYAGQAGVPSRTQLEEFKISYLVDLYPLAQRYAFPTMTYSIKDLAKLAKFSWSVEMAGGANSLFKYKDAINNNLEKSERDAAIAWLDSYNRDDVRATFAVRNYMRSLS